MSMSIARDYGAEQYFDRNKLFEDNVKLVKSIAQHICVRLPAGYALDDLVQVGLIGLLEASMSPP